MHRYFFNIIDGYSLIDRDGTELPDLATAKAEAIRTSGQVLRDMGSKFWDGPQWRMEVADDGGQILFTLHFHAQEGPDVRSSVLERHAF